MKRLAARQYIDGVLAGNRVVLARAITLVESELERDRELACQVLDACLPHTGRTRRIGVAGPPGAGKSTFLDRIGMHLIEERGESVAVLSIDPSSPVSGGSILGDKTRMQRLAAQERAFLRPSPARGHLGGVARRTREAMLLVEAAGFENVWIETVGVGQSEIAVRSMTDFFLLLLIPGAGDELQGMKRGILEMTDLVAIHKADGDNVGRAELARKAYESGLHLFRPPAGGWLPRTISCSSLTGENIPAIWEIILEHQRQQTASGAGAEQRRRQSLDWMKAEVQEMMEAEFRRHPRVAAALPGLERQVLDGACTATHAARRLLELFHEPQRDGHSRKDQ
ncbi:MAG: methylmalonyl Co-A mutase-associated GTPase MeaB [Bryobacterales bacterium]|nr:methylmalonyl Co-A mutase-associated GTPase MeaB [Bryobacterales bacterium]